MAVLKRGEMSIFTDDLENMHLRRMRAHCAEAKEYFEAGESALALERMKRAQVDSELAYRYSIEGKNEEMRRSMMDDAHGRLRGDL